ncbi:hypothetical protein FACS1894206_06130 [Deltaproteobacteria bacterium]|nr:hypothetical protein FACS1894206_06130 [Deltaproteobacteria bacterium]
MLEYYRFKEIHDLYTRGETEEGRKQLRELQARYVHLCDENAILRNQIQGYEDILYLSRNLIFDGTFYWLITGSIKQGPFCPVCYNRDGLLLRLSDDETNRICLTCGFTVRHSLPPVEKMQKSEASYGIARASNVLRKIHSPGDGANDGEAKQKATILPFVRPLARQGGIA